MINYTVSEKVVFLDEKLSIDEKAFLSGLWSLDGERLGVIEATYNDIMDLIKIRNRCKISKIISSLKEKGYIELIKTGRATRYFLHKGYLFYEGIKDKLFGGINKALDKESDEENTEQEVKEEKYHEVSTSINSETLEASTSSESENPEGSENGTLIIQENNTNIYIRILECWNSCNLGYIEELSFKNKLAIEKALLSFSVSEIIQGICNYSEILKSNYYYSFKWRLKSFLVKNNGLKRFVDSGDIWNNYTSKFKKTSSKKLEFDFTKYIE